MQEVSIMSRLSGMKRRTWRSTEAPMTGDQHPDDVATGINVVAEEIGDA